MVGWRLVLGRVVGEGEHWCERRGVVGMGDVGVLQGTCESQIETFAQ